MVLVIGAGVAGLSAARSLRLAGVAARLVDRHEAPGGAYRRMYARTELSSPPAYLALPGARTPPAEVPIQAEAYARYLADYARDHDLEIERRDVVSLERRDGQFHVWFRGQSQPTIYRAVVACTGSFDHPFVPRLPGLNDRAERSVDAVPAFHARDWRGPAALDGRRLLIVGGGSTAVELAEECARAGNRPVVSTRSGRVKLAPRRVFGLDPRRVAFPLLRRLHPSLFGRQCDAGWRYRGTDRGFAQFQASRQIDVRPAIRQVDRGRVAFVDGTIADIETVVFATGYRFDMSFVPAAIPRGTLGVPRQRHGQSLDWPGLFMVGVPCTVGGHSHFVHGMAADAPAVARAVQSYLASDPERAAGDRAVVPAPASVLGQTALLPNEPR